MPGGITWTAAASMQPCLVLGLAYSVCLVVAIQDRDIDVPNYDGYKVLRTLPKDLRATEALLGLQRSDKYDFWSPPSKVRPTDIMAPSARVQELKNWLQEHDIPYKVLISDLQNLISKQMNPAANYSLTRSSIHSMTWDKYHRLDTIFQFMDSLAAAYPQLVTVQTLGKSYEGRDMKVMKVSSGGCGKPAIFMNGGIHAREWVSPATVTYMMNELVENHQQYPEYINNMDWYFMPVINPDGYEYSHTSARMWRKTRSNMAPGTGCRGVDPNRNWDFHWNEAGVSDNPCSDVYCGEKAFSEIEMQIVSNFILKHRDCIKVYLDFHSYLQMWMPPWGYTTDFPSDYMELWYLGKKATDALRAVYGTEYFIGSPPSILYPASGNGMDWSKGVAGIKYSYGIELRDVGQHGFLLPPEEIVPSGTETWEAIKVIADEILENSD